MNFDKTSMFIGILIGIIIGFIVAGLLMFYGLSEIGNSIHIQSVTVNSSSFVTIPLNETRMIEAMNNSGATQHRAW